MPKPSLSPHLLGDERAPQHLGRQGGRILRLADVHATLRSTAQRSSGDTYTLHESRRETEETRRAAAAEQPE